MSIYEEKVLKVFSGEKELSGAEVSKQLGFWNGLSGWLYPALYRLERQGILESRWEVLDSSVGRPRSMMYRLKAKPFRGWYFPTEWPPT